MEQKRDSKQAKVAKETFLTQIIRSQATIIRVKNKIQQYKQHELRFSININCEHHDTGAQTKQALLVEVSLITAQGPAVTTLCAHSHTHLVEM